MEKGTTPKELEEVNTDCLFAATYCNLKKLVSLLQHLIWPHIEGRQRWNHAAMPQLHVVGLK